jgi:LysR family glycine cleavage system transcriptional activator
VASPLRLLSHSPDPFAALIGVSPPEGEMHPRLLPRMQPQGPGVDVDSLRCFDAVATTLRFRTAAARVHLSPAAFSDRIRRLEESLGARILVRTTRVVALTDTGHRLLPLTRRILGLIDCLPGTASGAEESETLSYELLVGTRSEVGLSWLCEILDPLAHKRPERTLHLYNGSSGDLLARVERGELDAVVTSTRFSSPRLTYAALHPEEYLLVGVERDLRCREDARRLTLVDISADLPLFRYFLDAQADAEPWPFCRVDYMGGIANVRHRLLTGEGRVGVLPTFLIKGDLAKRRLTRLMPRVHLRSDSLRLVWRVNHPRQTELLALAQDLRAFPLR